MPKFVFTKIVDNDNTDDFMIDVTQMDSHRMRMSALRAQCVRYHYYGLGNWRPIYRFFELDHSFYPVYKGDFRNLAAARSYKSQVLQECLDRRNKAVRE
jgi:hypothetical protein